MGPSVFPIIVTVSHRTHPRNSPMDRFSVVERNCVGFYVTRNKKRANNNRERKEEVEDDDEGGGG